MVPSRDGVPITSKRVEDAVHKFLRNHPRLLPHIGLIVAEVEDNQGTFWKIMTKVDSESAFAEVVALVKTQSSTKGLKWYETMLLVYVAMCSRWRHISDDLKHPFVPYCADIRHAEGQINTLLGRASAFVRSVPKKHTKDVIVTMRTAEQEFQCHNQTENGDPDEVLFMENALYRVHRALARLGDRLGFSPARAA